MAAPRASDFQWLSGHEAVLHRPDAYVGGLDPVQEETYVVSADATGQGEIIHYSMSRILMKIVDEVLVNAMDCASRDSLLRYIRCSFEPISGEFVVENDGMGIPIEEFENSGRLIPSVVFSELHAGSNFQDEHDRLTGGRNGVGVSCTNVWSSTFEVEVRDTKKRFVQRFSKNLTVVDAPEVSPCHDRNGLVRVRFVPDYARLGIDLTQMAPIIEKLVRTRCAEIATCARPGVAVRFQNRQLPNKCSALLQSMAGCCTFAEEKCGDASGAGCTVCVGWRQVGRDFHGFINGIRCDSGTLAEAVRSKLVRLVAELVKKRHQVGVVRPQTVRDVLAVVCVARIVNPRFTSQAKTSLCTTSKHFGFVVDFEARFGQKLLKLGVIEEIAKRETQRELTVSLRKAQAPRSRDVMIEKYDPALDCRSDRGNCTLILTEGDSAKAFVVAGLSAIGRNKHGVFPLRGVPLNVTNTPIPKILDNNEIANIFRILNQKPDFLQRIITPIIRARHKRSEMQKVFFSLPDFHAWERETENVLSNWTLKYYKGLGTSSSKEAREIFRDLSSHTIGFGVDAAAPETLARFYDESRSNERKQLLTADYDETLAVDYAATQCTISEFMLKEHIHFSHYSIFRALPSVIDGLTPSRRKALFYFFQQRSSTEEKVAQAASGVAKKTAYLHGETSLVETIVSLAQDYVGTNNIALLQPVGQFGSRNDKPSAHAAARYIFTRLDPVARALFPESDDAVLAYRTEEGQQIEPVNYVPVLPLLAINGAQGIGTGFSTCVPSFSFEDLSRCARELAAGQDDLSPIRPAFHGFKGSVHLLPHGVQTTGILTRTSPRDVAITELPIGRWTGPFLSELKACADGSKAIKGLHILSITNMCTEFSVHIELVLGEENAETSDEDLARLLKLSQTISTTHMYAFDACYQVQRYDDVHAIAKQHASERLRLYAKRKEHQLSEMENRLVLLHARARFIRLVIDGTIPLRGSPRSDLLQALRTCELPSLPTRSDAEGFDYLLHTNISAFTREKIDALTQEAKRLEAEVADLRALTPSQMWLREIDALEIAFADYTARLQRRQSEEEVAHGRGATAKHRPRAASRGGNPGRAVSKKPRTSRAR